MSENDDPTGRDFRVIFRTVTVVAVVVATTIGGIIYVVSEWVQIKTRVDQVEKWQNAKDRDAARELWRRDRGSGGERAPIVPPKG